MGKLLARVHVHAAGTDPEAVLGKAHGPVGKEGQHLRVGPCLVHGMPGEGVARSGEGCHGKTVHFLGLPCLCVVADCLSARQKEEFALPWQGYELVGPWQAPLLSPAHKHEEFGLVVDIAGFVRNHQTGIQIPVFVL